MADGNIVTPLVLSVMGLVSPLTKILPNLLHYSQISYLIDSKIKSNYFFLKITESKLRMFEM